MIKKGVGGIGAASTLQRSYVKAQIFLYWSFTAPRIMRCECTHAMEPLTFPNQYYTRQILRSLCSGLPGTEQNLCTKY